MSRHLIIDGHNNFIRCFSVVPTTNSNGVPTGGLFGFLRSLRMFVELCKPDKIVVVFDGPGGSQKRRAIDKNYKSNRKPIRPAVNADIVDIAENLKWQFARLFEYLDDLPVYRLIIDNVEADDTIAYLTSHFKDGEQIIVSSDKDFYQLLDDKVKIYNAMKKLFFTKEDCIKQFNIHPHNFVIAKAIVGDGSDNLHGVKGIGYKNVLKYFPFLSSEDKLSINDIEKFSEEKCIDQKNIKYQKFLDAKENIRQNYQLMQLEETIISLQGIKKIDDILMNAARLNMTGFKLKLMEDGISSISDRNFFDSFKYLVNRGNDGQPTTENSKVR